MFSFPSTRTRDIRSMRNEIFLENIFMAYQLIRLGPVLNGFLSQRSLHYLIWIWNVFLLVLWDSQIDYYQTIREIVWVKTKTETSIFYIGVVLFQVSLSPEQITFPHYLTTIMHAGPPKMLSCDNLFHYLTSMIVELNSVHVLKMC